MSGGRSSPAWEHSSCPAPTWPGARGCTDAAGCAATGSRRSLGECARRRARRQLHHLDARTHHLTHQLLIHRVAVTKAQVAHALAAAFQLGIAVDELRAV